MSEENVETAKKLIATLADREGEIEAILPYFDPGVRWTTAEDEPDHQTYEGHDGIRGLFAAWSDLWEAGFETAAEPQGFHAKDQHVVVPVRARVRGRSSGVDVEINETYWSTFREGKMVRVHEFRTKEEGLRAAELSE
jgi:ketosteroid isomerase-like protein